MIDLIDDGYNISIITGIWNETSEDIIGYDPERNMWEIAAYYEGEILGTYEYTYEQMINKLKEAVNATRLSQSSYRDILDDIKSVIENYK